MVLVCCECTCILWRNCVAVRNGGHHGGGVREKKWTRFGLSVVRLSRAKLANLRMSTSGSPKMGPTPPEAMTGDLVRPPGVPVDVPHFQPLSRPAKETSANEQAKDSAHHISTAHTGDHKLVFEFAWEKSQKRGGGGPQFCQTAKLLAFT